MGDLKYDELAIGLALSLAPHMVCPFKIPIIAVLYSTIGIFLHKKGKINNVAKHEV